MHQFAGLAAARSKSSIKAPDAPRAFDGPVRVRTSVAATAIAAVIPAALAGALFQALLSIILPATRTQIFLTTLVAAIVPSVILIVCTHQIARALDRRRGPEYAALGAVMTASCSVVIAPFMPFVLVMLLLVPAILYGAILGALYRGLAGIEPVPLPEAVVVADVNALVSADHPSRQQPLVVHTE
jgi:hypothetical protein